MSPMPNTITPAPAPGASQPPGLTPGPTAALRSGPSLPRMMGHIALTYVTRPWRSLAGLMMAIGCVGYYIMGCFGFAKEIHQSQQWGLVFTVGGFVCLPGYLVLHWLQQMASPGHEAYPGSAPRKHW